MTSPKKSNKNVAKQASAEKIAAKIVPNPAGKGKAVTRASQSAAKGVLKSASQSSAAKSKVTAKENVKQKEGSQKKAVAQVKGQETSSRGMKAPAARVAAKAASPGKRTSGVAASVQAARGAKPASTAARVKTTSSAASVSAKAGATPVKAQQPVPAKVKAGGQASPPNIKKAASKSKIVTSTNTSKTTQASSAKAPASKPVASKPVASKSVASKSAASKPAPAAVTKSAPATAKTAAVKLSATKSSQAKPAAAKPAATKSSPAKSSLAKPASAAVNTPANTASANTASARTAPAKTAPAKTAPVASAAAPAAKSVSAPAASAKPAVSAAVSAPAVARAAPVDVRPAAAVKPAVKPNQPHGFKAHDFIVYPAHGVGQISAIEQQEVAGFKLELFVIDFAKDKMTLKVPLPKVLAGAIRKLSSTEQVTKALGTLTGRARIKRTMWSRRAQEYEAKINSGDLVTIAEVVRDLYRSDAQPEQSYSERQLYEAALDRMAREVAAVQKLTDSESLKVIESYLQRGPRRGARSEDAADGVAGDEVANTDNGAIDEAA